MRRGDIFIADLTPRSGSEQSGVRPVIVVSHDGFNEEPNWRTIIVVPLSTSINQARRELTSIPLFAGEGGLPHDSVALCHQVTTLDKAKVREKLGSLSQSEMIEIETGLKESMRLRA